MGGTSGLTVTLADARDVSLAGGKGASLGELARAGIAVPPGFVVTVDGFAAAMAGIDPSGALRAQLEALGAGDTALLGRACAALRARITEAPLPPAVAGAITAGYAALAAPPEALRGAALPDTVSPEAAPPEVAVRSSATMEDSAAASFAGLQDTYLGVAGPEAVLEHVRRCWASLYNEESVAYRRRLGLPEADVAMAVVVQRMVAPRAAGVLFTRSPVTGDRSVVAIEGVWGLGSALVSGDVTPDSFIISKITGEITTRRISAKLKTHTHRPNARVAPRHPPAESPPGQHPGPGVAVEDTPVDRRDAPCLTDDEIRALAAIGRQVEAHYGAPQDIEWALLDPDESPDAPNTAEDATPSVTASITDVSGVPPTPHSPAAPRIVLLQSRPETVWAAKDPAPAGAPKPRPADHVLALFGKHL
ncbi:MAG: PEP/pyruvate-binding domain-containing protein [Trebonia sp.]